MPSEKSFKQRRTFGEFPAKGRGGTESLTPSAGFPGPFRASSLGRAAGAAGGAGRRRLPSLRGGIGEAGRGQISLRALQIPTPGPVPADSGGGGGVRGRSGPSRPAPVTGVAVLLRRGLKWKQTVPGFSGETGVAACSG